MQNVKKKCNVVSFRIKLPPTRQLLMFMTHVDYEFDKCECVCVTKKSSIEQIKHRTNAEKSSCISCNKFPEDEFDKQISIYEGDN